MKTFLLIAVILFMSIDSFTQQAITIYKKDGSGSIIILSNNIDSITFRIPSGAPCVGIPTVTYGGQVYNTAQIGSQCWLKENLNAGTRINTSSDQTDNGTIEKYCYNNDPEYCTTYGGLYQWAEAVLYQNGATNNTSPNPPYSENVQGICPAGWHIPTSTEQQTLATAVGNSDALKEIGQGTGAGAGTNTSNFSGLLAGIRWMDGSSTNFGTNATFWSSSVSDNNYTYVQVLNSNSNSTVLFWYLKGVGVSVRCLKD